MSLDGRNTLPGIAARVNKNLAFIASARTKEGADVHVVTQLLLSLLGLVVFPVQALKNEGSTALQTEMLDDLEANGWPKWKFTIGESSDLQDLLIHIRNAVSHHRLSFSSDSRNIEDVEITFRDRRPAKDSDNWQAHISAKDLQQFVQLLSELLSKKERNP